MVFTVVVVVVAIAVVIIFITGMSIIISFAVHVCHVIHVVCVVATAHVVGNMVDVAVVIMFIFFFRRGSQEVDAAVVGADRGRSGRAWRRKPPSRLQLVVS